MPTYEITETSERFRGIPFFGVVEVFEAVHRILLFHYGDMQTEV